MAKPQSVTSLSISPEEERKRRMIRYTVAMSIRVVCLVLGMVVQGWLMWLFFAGAILLPYFAVVLANDNGGAGNEKKLAKATAPTLTISADAFLDGTKDRS